jgi:hypothetical protein
MTHLPLLTFNRRAGAAPNRASIDCRHRSERPSTRQRRRGVSSTRLLRLTLQSTRLGIDRRSTLGPHNKLCSVFRRPSAHQFLLRNCNSHGGRVSDLTGKDRLIVALDVPTVDEALGIVEQLDNVSFFKIGLQLFMTGGLPTLLQSLRQKQVFVDLKIPGDIANTISAVVELCVTMKVTFLTLSESMPLPAVAVARTARNARHSSDPKLLTVPFLSSLDATDLGTIAAGEADLDTFILKRAHAGLSSANDYREPGNQACGRFGRRP